MTIIFLLTLELILKIRVWGKSWNLRFFAKPKWLDLELPTIIIVLSLFLEELLCGGLYEELGGVGVLGGRVAVQEVKRTHRHITSLKYKYIVIYQEWFHTIHVLGQEFFALQTTTIFK